MGRRGRHENEFWGYIADRISVENRGYASSCWVWQKALTEKGYGRARVPGGRKIVRVHRATFERCYGPIPDGMMIDHLCRTPACCNPAHLEAVTNGENQRRAIVARPQRTHCGKGHELTPDNVSIVRGRERVCRTCRNAYMRARTAANARKFSA